MSGGDKRENMESKSTVTIPQTTYEPAPATLKNFPSSIMNGITEEGGLYSLTFKSAACANLVENFEWMRQVVFKSESNDRLSRINPDKFDGEKLVETLKRDIEQLKQPESDIKDIPIDSLKRKFDDAIEKKLDLKDIGQSILDNYYQTNKNIRLSISDGTIRPQKIHIPNLKVEKYDESKHKDLPAYQKKVEQVKEVIEIPEEATDKPQI